MIEKTNYSVNEHFLHLYFVDQQQIGRLPILTKRTLPTRGNSKIENFVHVLLMVELDIGFEFRLKTLNVLKVSPSNYTCKELKNSLVKVGRQFTWLGPLLLSERLQTIKCKSMETKNIIPSDGKVQFQIL